MEHLPRPVHTLILAFLGTGRLPGLWRVSRRWPPRELLASSAAKATFTLARLTVIHRLLRAAPSSSNHLGRLIGQRNDLLRAVVSDMEATETLDLSGVGRETMAAFGHTMPYQRSADEALGRLDSCSGSGSGADNGYYVRLYNPNLAAGVRFLRADAHLLGAAGDLQFPAAESVMLVGSKVYRSHSQQFHSALPAVRRLFIRHLEATVPAGWPLTVVIGQDPSLTALEELSLEHCGRLSPDRLRSFFGPRLRKVSLLGDTRFTCWDLLPLLSLRRRGLAELHLLPSQRRLPPGEAGEEEEEEDCSGDTSQIRAAEDAEEWASGWPLLFEGLGPTLERLSLRCDTLELTADRLIGQVLPHLGNSLEELTLTHLPPDDDRLPGRLLAQLGSRTRGLRRLRLEFSSSREGEPEWAPLLCIAALLSPALDAFPTLESLCFHQADAAAIRLQGITTGVLLEEALERADPLVHWLYQSGGLTVLLEAASSGGDATTGTEAETEAEAEAEAAQRLEDARAALDKYPSPREEICAEMLPPPRALVPASPPSPPQGPVVLRGWGAEQEKKLEAEAMVVKRRLVDRIIATQQAHPSGWRPGDLVLLLQKHNRLAPVQLLTLPCPYGEGAWYVRNLQGSHRDRDRDTCVKVDSRRLIPFFSSHLLSDRTRLETLFALPVTRIKIDWMSSICRMGW